MSYASKCFVECGNIIEKLLDAVGLSLARIVSSINRASELDSGEVVNSLEAPV
jgi:hypothetical protein